MTAQDVRCATSSKGPLVHGDALALSLSCVVILTVLNSDSISALLALHCLCLLGVRLGAPVLCDLLSGFPCLSHFFRVALYQSKLQDAEL